ncbi:MAG: hypothetical protein NTY77_12170 [Elusimicrobia bacterium]|nr:hypothetical protein [Elusimicrobiota bacterium]
MIFKLIPLLFGAYFTYAGLGSLALAAFGARADALVDETVIKTVKEVPAADGTAPTYVMRTKVSYHFEVCPKHPQAPEGLCATAEGSDTWILRTPYSVLAHDKGYAVPVVFLSFAPGLNAVRQPKHLVVYGLLELLLGLAIVVFEVQVLRRERRERLAGAGDAPLPSAEPQDSWRELEKPIVSGGSRPPGPDEDIRPS